MLSYAKLKDSLRQSWKKNMGVAAFVDENISEGS